MLEMKYASRRMPVLSDRGAMAVAAATSAIMIRPLAPEARFSLRLHEEVLEQVKEAAGFSLHLPVNRSASSGDRVSLRLGPNEWLLIAPESDADEIAAQIGSALAGHFHALVDVGHRNVAIEVAGRSAADVLNSGCPLDLAAGAFPTGYATRTLMGKAEIVLMRLDDAPRYRVECWRSFAAYVHAFLMDSAREFEAV